MDDSLSDMQKIILKENLKKSLEIIFTDSLKNLNSVNDAISFAYGWLLLAYSTEYKVIENKLSILQSEIQSNLLNKNIEFIIEPTLRLARLCAAEAEILNEMGLNAPSLLAKADLIVKYISQSLNPFLMKIYQFKQQVEELSENEQKTIIFKEINSF